MINKKHRQKQARAKQGGFSMMEVLLVLGVAAVIIAGVIGLYSTVQDQQAGQAEANAVHITVSELSKIYRGKPKTGLNNTVAVSLGVVGGFDAGVSTVTNSWGKAVTIVPGQINFADDAISLTMEVEKDTCATLVTATENAGFSINVNGTAVKSNGGSINVTTLATQCQAGSDPNFVSVQWLRL